MKVGDETYFLTSNSLPDPGQIQTHDTKVSSDDNIGMGVNLVYYFSAATSSAKISSTFCCNVVDVRDDAAIEKRVKVLRLLQ